MNANGFVLQFFVSFVYNSFAFIIAIRNDIVGILILEAELKTDHNCMF